MLLQQLLGKASFVLEVFLHAPKSLFLMEMCESDDFMAFSIGKIISRSVKIKGKYMSCNVIITYISPLFPPQKKKKKSGTCDLD